jgi:hypothetical protein
LLEIAGVDGVAVARGTLGNPWLIPRITNYIETGKLDDPPTDIERLICAYRHCLALIRYKGLRVGANESRRHLTHYTKGITGTAPFRARLTQINASSEVAAILTELAEMIGGSEGKRDFLEAAEASEYAAANNLPLFSVQDTDFENSETPGERDGKRESHVHTPVNIFSLAPVAKP